MLQGRTRSIQLPTVDAEAAVAVTVPVATSSTNTCACSTKPSNVGASGIGFVSVAKPAGPGSRNRVEGTPPTCRRQPPIGTAAAWVPRTSAAGLDGTASSRSNTSRGLPRYGVDTTRRGAGEPQPEPLTVTEGSTCGPRKCGGGANPL